MNKISEKIFFENKYELKNVTIEEIAKIRNGKDWKSLGQGDIPVYGSGGKMNIYVNKYSYNKPTVLIPRKGSIKNVFYLDEPFWNVDTIFYTEIDDKKIIPKYFYYFIENFDIAKLSTDFTRPSLTQSILNKIKIALPPIPVQNKVVEILDKFQSLLSDTKGLLPQEIEQRQKQYEYYREKLLTFDENMVERGYISKWYLTLLKEAAYIVGVKLFGVEWKKLKDITQYSSKRVLAESLNAENYVGVENLLKDKLGKVDSSYVPNKGNLIAFEKGDILIGNIRPYLRKIWMANVDGGTNGDVLAIV